MPPVDEAKALEEQLWQAVEFRGAVDRGDVEKVDEMLNPPAEKGAVPAANPVYKPEGTSWTVLMLAANSGQDSLVEKFSKGGRMPKIEDTDPHGFQALMLAAYQGHVPICEKLIAKNANVNAKNASGETPLMMAAAEGHRDVVNLLLGAGADPDALDSNEMSAIKKAARWGRADCLKALLEKVQADRRQLKHCMLFGELFKHEEIVTIIKNILDPKEAVEAGDGGEEAIEKAA